MRFIRALLVWSVLAMIISSYQVRASQAVDFWETNPTIYFDQEFTNDVELRAVAEEAVATLNKELVNIQLEHIFTQDNYRSFQTYYQETGSSSVQDYNDEVTDWQDSHDNAIQVISDEYNQGFGGAFNKNTSYGVVRLKTSYFAEKSFSEMVDILIHELLHALGLKHQLGPLMDQGSGNWNLTVAESPVQQRTRPLMDPFVSSLNTGLTAQDIQAIQKLYGYKCAEKEITILFEDDVQALNVAFVPGKKKIRKLIKNNFGKKKRDKYVDRVNKYAVASSTFGSEARLLILPGAYIVEVRSFRGATAGSSAIEGEEGPSTFEGQKYLRFNKSTGNYKVVDNVRYASKIIVEEDQEIVVESFI